MNSSHILYSLVMCYSLWTTPFKVAFLAIACKYKPKIERSIAVKSISEQCCTNHSRWHHHSVLPYTPASHLHTHLQTVRASCERTAYIVWVILGSPESWCQLWSNYPAITGVIYFEYINWWIMNTSRMVDYLALTFCHSTKLILLLITQHGK